MAEGEVIRNSLEILGDLTVRDITYLGVAGQAGTSREFFAQGLAADIHVEINPKGVGLLLVPASYDVNIGTEDRAVINRGYFKQFILANQADATAQAPGAGEDQFAIVYDHPSTQWTLKAVAAALSYEDGVNESGGIVRLGGDIDEALTNVKQIATGDIYVQAFQGTNSAGLRAYTPANNDNRVEVFYGATSKIALQNNSFIITANVTDAMKYAADYSGLFTARSIPDLSWVNTHLGGKNVNALITAPGGPQNGWVVYWDNVGGEYSLKVVSGGGGGGHVIQNSGTPIANQPNLNFTNGLTAVDDAGNSASVVRFGGALTQATTVSGAFSLLFNTSSFRVDSTGSGDSTEFFRLREVSTNRFQLFGSGRLIHTVNRNQGGGDPSYAINDNVTYTSTISGTSVVRWVDGTLTQGANVVNFDILRLAPTVSAGGFTPGTLTGIRYNPSVGGFAGTNYFIDATSGIVKIATPTNQDANVRLLTINSGTNHIEWRSSDTFWKTSGTTLLTASTTVTLPVVNGGELLKLTSGDELGGVAVYNSRAVSIFNTALDDVQYASLSFDIPNDLGDGAGVIFRDERTVKLGIQYFSSAYGAGFTNSTLIHRSYADARYAPISLSSSGSNNEVQTSNGSGGFVASKLFFDETTGHAIFGDTALAGTERTISSDGVSDDIDIGMNPKGSGLIWLRGATFVDQGIFIADDISSETIRITIDASSSSIEAVKITDDIPLFSIEGASGISGFESGGSVAIYGGNGHSVGDNNGGHIFLKPGSKNGAGLDANIGLFTDSVANWQAMERGIFIANALTVPTGNPTGGGFFYVEAGALKFRGSSGTVTTVAPA